MEISQQYKKEQDLIFQELGEMELRERQVAAADEEAKKRRGSWFHDDLTRRLQRKKFFRAMSKDQQDEFVRNSISEWRRRTSPNPGADVEGDSR